MKHFKPTYHYWIDLYNADAKRIATRLSTIKGAINSKKIRRCCKAWKIKYVYWTYRRIDTLTLKERIHDTRKDEGKSCNTRAIVRMYKRGVRYI